MMFLCRCQITSGTCLLKRDVVANKVQRSVARFDQGSRVPADQFAFLHGRPAFEPLRSNVGKAIGARDAVCERDREDSIMLSPLNECREFDTDSIVSRSDANNIAIDQLELLF